MKTKIPTWVVLIALILIGVAYCVEKRYQEKPNEELQVKCDSLYRLALKTRFGE